MYQLAARRRVPFQILDFDLPTDELRRRVAQRQQQPEQISEATCAVLDYQLAHQEPLDEGEKKLSFSVTPDMTAAEVFTKLAAPV